MDELAPYLKPPLTFRDGSLVSCSIEESIQQNVRLLLETPPQALAKSSEIAAEPEYGADLPHHHFNRGPAGEMVRQIRNAIKRNEPRFQLTDIKFTDSRPGRYLPYRYVRIIGKVRDTGLTMEFEIDVEG